MEDVRFLCDDALRGRDVGTEEIDASAEYIAKRFTELGLRTDLFNRTPFQNFSVDTRLTAPANEKNYLRLNNGETPFRLGETYNPLSVGAAHAGSGEVVFVGYGITAERLDYDDYAGIDVAGKVVIALRREPTAAPFGGKQPTPNAFFSTKVINAASHRVAALIFVNDRSSLEKGKGVDQILKVDEAGSAPNTPLKPAVFFCSRGAIDPWVKSSLGRSLEELEQQIASTGKPASMPLPGLRIEFGAAFEKESVLAKNVVGELPGEGKLAHETVILGAHYDHVGMGGVGSLAPGTIAVHNGADDNASGTAVMLEAARQIVARAKAEPHTSRRRIVFIAFSAEERGLLGSIHYVKEPRWPLEDTVTMVNLDMVGRLVSNRLTVYGMGSGTLIADHVRRRGKLAQIELDEELSGYGPSDHQSFYQQKIPVLHFFTGLHNDYHRPSDDFEKINFSGMVRITDVTTGVVWDVACDPARPTYQSTRRGGPMRQQPNAALGVSLDLQSKEIGATIKEVNRDGAAVEAGLLPGDRILGLDDREVASAGEFREQIRTCSVGQTVKLKVQRGAETLEIRVRLKASSN